MNFWLSTQKYGACLAYEFYAGKSKNELFGKKMQLAE